MSNTKQRDRLHPASVVLFSLLPVAILLGIGETTCRLLDLPHEPSRLVIRVGLDDCYFKTTDNGDITLCEPPGTPGRRVLFSPEKRRGTCRVAFLGGSSVRIPGSPYRGWPERIGNLVHGVEVINLGVPGANSAAAVLRGEEAAQWDVDVFVAYVGHNDVAQGVYSGLSDPAVAASLRWIRWRILLNRSALYRTILSLVSPLSPVPRDEQAGMVRRTVPLYDKPARQTLARTLRANLEHLVSAVAPRPVILIVPASNPHWNPTGTLVPTDASDAARLSERLEKARGLLDTGRAREALSALQAILETYPDSAYGWWLRALALARVGEDQRAAYAAGRARDLDALPMRATTEVEEAVRRTQAYAVVDLPARLPREAGLLRADLFMDAIHFSDKGQAAVAGTVAPFVSKACRTAHALPGHPLPPPSARNRASRHASTPR